jgi:hypothetical protein
MFSFNSFLYFIYSPTAGGTQRIAKVSTGDALTNVTSNLVSGFTFDYQVSFNSKIYFSGTGKHGVSKIFSLNTSDVITQISNATGDQSQPDPIAVPFVVAGSDLYFTVSGYNAAAPGVHNGRIYKINSSDVLSVASRTNVPGKNIYEGGSSLISDVPTAELGKKYAFNSTLYFWANNEYSVQKLFRI